MKFYSGKGDDGMSTFFGLPGRFSKTDARFEALGSIDELNTYLGIPRSLTNDGEIDRVLKTVQENLFIIQAEIGSPKTKTVATITEEKVKELEAIIDRFGEIVGEMRPFRFTIAGGDITACHLDYARTIARRAERNLMVIKHTLSQPAFSYINRVSSLLFVLARFLNKKANIEEDNPSYN